MNNEKASTSKQTDRNAERPPPVSIFITTYLGSPERGEVLKATCENALAQNYPDFEVVVSDNAGPYPAEKALASIDDPRLRVVRNEENLGQVGNSNMCLQRCRHDIIKVHCDDDLLHPDCLRVTVPLVNDDTYVVVDKLFFVIGQSPKELNDPLPENLEIDTQSPGYGKDFWGDEQVSLPGCCLFTRKLFTDLGGYDERTRLFDYDFLLMARLRKNIAFVQYPLCWMGEWEDSLSFKMMRDQPFFFATGQLYGQFKVLKIGGLDDAEHRSLTRCLIGRFLWEGLRLPRHLLNGKYWKGWYEYARETIRLARAPASEFLPEEDAD